MLHVPMPVPNQYHVNSSRNRSTPCGVERRLTTLRVAHLDDLDIRRLVDIAHRLWSNEDELAADGTACCLYNHGHASLAVHTVHEDIAIHVSPDQNCCKENSQFVKAANR